MIRRLVILIALIILCPLKSYAGIFHLSDYHTYGPLPIRTQNPLYLLFVGDSLERSVTLPQGGFSTSIETTFANLFERNPQTIGIGLDLDMELLRTAFNFSYGVTDYYEVGVQVPFVSFSGGFLDSFIQDYHDFFGFPNGGRDQVPNGRFSYQVTQNGSVLYEVDQANFRFSDLVLLQKLYLFKETKTVPAIAVKNSIKLPTGSRAEGTGSGKPDIGLSLLAEKSYKRLHSYTQLGFIALGGHEELNPILKNGSLTFGQALEFNVFEYLSLVGQVSGQSSIFSNTELPELSKMPLDLTFGFTGEVPFRKGIKKIRYLAAFTEDPIVDGPSVDFSLYFNVGVEY